MGRAWLSVLTASYIIYLGNCEILYFLSDIILKMKTGIRKLILAGGFVTAVLAAVYGCFADNAPHLTRAEKDIIDADGDSLVHTFCYCYYNYYICNNYSYNNSVEYEKTGIPEPICGREVYFG